MGRRRTDDAKAMELQRYLEKDDKERMQQAFEWIANDVRGRDFVAWLFRSDVCGLIGGAFDVNPLEMARKEGRRQVAIRVLGELQAVEPHVYAWIQAEAAERLEEAMKATQVAESDHDEEKRE